MRKVFQLLGSKRVGNCCGCPASCSVYHYIHAFLYNQRFFSTQPQCCLTVSCIEVQMLLTCCLIHIIIIILGHILYLVYLCPCPGLGLFMSCLCDLFFISSLIFIAINRITSFKQMHLFFCTFFRRSLIFG